MGRTRRRKVGRTIGVSVCLYAHLGENIQNVGPLFFSGAQLETSTTAIESTLAHVTSYALVFVVIVLSCETERQDTHCEI